MIFSIAGGVLAEKKLAESMTYKEAMLWLYQQRYDDYVQRKYFEHLNPDR